MSIPVLHIGGSTDALCTMAPGLHTYTQYKEQLPAMLGLPLAPGLDMTLPWAVLFSQLPAYPSLTAKISSHVAETNMRDFSVPVFMANTNVLLCAAQES